MTSGGTGGVVGGAGGTSGAGASGGSGVTGGGGATSGSGGGGGVVVEDPGTMSADARIYTTDGSEFVIDEVGDALEHALSGGGVDNVIVYVHGRACGGGEPSKSLEGSMPEMEADYSARVLMFNWPGADEGCPLGFPETEARASGAAFAHTLHKLAYFKATHGPALAGIKLTLITHSMGNLVLEEAAETDVVPLPSTLFDTVVVGSSATARDDHHLWLSKVGFSPNLYVTENNSDSVLTAAGAFGTRLGKNVNGAMLAANAVYVDFTAASVNHAYYIHSGQDGAHMMAFYDAVMNGQPYDFGSSDAIASVEERDGTFLYFFDGQ